MSRWVDAGPAHDVAEDRPLGREIEGVSLVLLRRGDEWAAVEDRCPHMAFPLSEGFVREGRLVCSLHRWEFEIFGPVPAAVPPELRCRRFPVRRRGDRVEVDLSGADRESTG